MSPVEDERDGVEVSRLLAGAAKTVANAQYCWLATTAENGGVNARPMGRLLRDPDENDWTIRFIADGRSRKASDIRRARQVAVIFQHAADHAYVTLIGVAKLREGASEVRRRWKNAYDVYFPSEQDRANAAFVEIDADRMELWIRGVTPEPFGLQPTIIERDPSGDWRLIPGDRNAVR
jgi:general stress protein 26